MATQGVDFDGNKLPSAPNFGIAVAVHPYLRPIELSILQVKKKIAAGAQVLLTDPIFDVAGFEQWMQAVCAAGLDKKAAIVASVLPLQSVAQAEYLKARSGFVPMGDDVISRLKGASDTAQAGIAIVSEIAGKVKAIAGVRGIHIHSDGCEQSVAKIIQEARLA
jgi:5,10-methylenetetrahydrofolate reductase